MTLVFHREYLTSGLGTKDQGQGVKNFQGQGQELEEHYCPRGLHHWGKYVTLIHEVIMIEL